ncbi:TonB-dependent receptor [Sphingomonas populi]|uniref:TonB-dependent receptor n=1 Tax=Sphingomonas populi TaxID=2484750 RepID=A0A4Q6Y8A2_9SPHN|nr:TonB-dependent receptor [Sphingomonas populi]RZF66304.1 TonB-dependent receptor [Sphingomonas populi]
MIGGNSLRNSCLSAQTRFLLMASAALSGGVVLPAHAQSGVDSESGAQAEIIVTARRKNEDILKTPITLSAITAEALAAKGTATIQDIAQSVPGMNVQNAATAGARADRSITSIQLRGFVPTTSAAQTASLFIDGAPVSTATALQALTNPERVEVIKGPQSALFGRQTFAGAINVVTKAPSNRLTGSASMSLGTRANYDVQGEISAPLVEDILSFRASGRVLGKNGSYRNAGAPGDSSLGDQMTYTGSLAVQFTPTPNLTIKAFGLATELNDGPAASGLITAQTIPGVTIGQSNCTVNGRAWFCGVAPGISNRTPSSNVAVTDTLRNFLALRTGDRLRNGTVARLLPPEDSVNGYGLVNHFRHYHVNADWNIGESGFALHSLTSWNTEKKAEMADLDNTYNVTLGVGGAIPEGAYYNFPFLIQNIGRDFSQELRTTFENGGPLHASFGGSYLLARQWNDAGSPYTGSFTANGSTQSRTYGVFGSLGYDFSEAFSLSFDGRYQIDKLYAFAAPTGFRDSINNVTLPFGSTIAYGQYKNFLPRVIGQFNWDRRNMIYASYSKGVNPGTFNTNIVSTPEPQVRARAAALGFQVVVNPEKITNYELGAKGRIFGGKVRYEVAAFLAIWSDQIQSQLETITKQAIVGDTGPATVGSLLQVSAAGNTGRTRIWGLEGNYGINLVRGLDLDLAGAYIKTYILTGTNTTVSNFYFGIPNSNFRGKENPYVSKWSGSASLAYQTPIKDNLDGFGRVDFTYKSGGWADIGNTVRAPNTNQMNVRLGVKNKTFIVEGWMTNVFNNRAYYNISSQPLINYVTPAGTGAYGALVAQLRDLRTAGVRVGVNF